MDRQNARRGPSLPRDYGKDPLVIDIDRAAKINPTYRTALWTGEFLQVTLMSIPVGGDIGMEMHPDTDQFIRMESGYAMVTMGPGKDMQNVRRRIGEDDAVAVPAGTWHNIVNIGRIPLKLYSVYAPPHHPFGTVHQTKEDAEPTVSAANQSK